MEQLQPLIENEATADKKDKKRFEKILIKQTELQLEQNDLLLKKELYLLCDKHSEVEHQIRVIQGKAVKTSKDEEILDELATKLSRIVNQKAALEDQINPEMMPVSPAVEKKKKSGLGKFNPKKMVNKAKSNLLKN